jgi:Na+/H+-dicarboxylate symporter
MGGRTIVAYLLTTLTAVIIGLVLVNVIQPGKSISIDTREELIEAYASETQEKQAVASKTNDSGPLQALVDIVPSNFIKAASNNRNMLQVIFFALFFGVGMILIPINKSKPVKSFFDSFNDIILKLIDLIMMSAPYGVFALLATLVVEAPSLELFKALALYAITLLLALAIMILVYILVVRFFTKRSTSFFIKGIAPAQLLAFSTSSSAATLPVTMECVESNLGVDEEVASFVLPIGATINMDGTSVYQGVAAVFIAQAFGLELDIIAQLGIVLTATLASIGTAAVPSAGIVMLVIVLAQAGIPEAGLALIFAIDRPLDMCRTIVNVSGDAAISMVIAKSLGKLKS